MHAALLEDCTAGVSACADAIDVGAQTNRTGGRGGGGSVVAQHHCSSTTDRSLKVHQTALEGAGSRRQLVKANGLTAGDVNAAGDRGVVKGLAADQRSTGDEDVAPLCDLASQSEVGGTDEDRCVAEAEGTILVGLHRGTDIRGACGQGSRAEIGVHTVEVEVVAPRLDQVAAHRARDDTVDAEVDAAAVADVEGARAADPGGREVDRAAQAGAGRATVHKEGVTDDGDGVGDWGVEAQATSGAAGLVDHQGGLTQCQGVTDRKR